MESNKSQIVNSRLNLLKRQKYLFDDQIIFKKGGLKRKLMIKDKEKNKISKRDTVMIMM